MDFIVQAFHMLGKKIDPFVFVVSRSCSVPVTFVVSNCSLTHPAEFVFRLPSSESKKGSSP